MNEKDLGESRPGGPDHEDHDPTGRRLLSVHHAPPHRRVDPRRGAHGQVRRDHHRLLVVSAVSFQLVANSILPLSRAGHLRYFKICSIVKNDFHYDFHFDFHIFYQLNLTGDRHFKLD